ncbi:cysteine proteinase inhibitor A-like isoform X1 [Camellia sinensis]|uniref:cysteine proteinase inhibitor A-like isoform X1 n=1 Tax=Camellia sinensis TaxID=4442 RepID=UPI001036EA0F|nr:cysteine proteinase inhibitor A-like isoform X1 [Camellia sinensis]
MAELGGITDVEGAANSSKRAISGGITEVKDAENSLEMASLARFAVDEHNKKENACLEFSKVVNAKQQVVAGMMYYITLEATNGGQKKAYEAKVWEKSWMKFKELQEFKPIGDAPSHPRLVMTDVPCASKAW